MVLALHANFISCRVSFVLWCFYKNNSSCLHHGENSYPFCLAELWPCTACIDHLHSLRFQHQCYPHKPKYKKIILVSHTRPLNFISAPQKAKHYFYWSILTADDSIKCRSANSSMTGQVGGFQNPGVFLSARVSFLSSPPPPRSFTSAIFCAVFNLLLFLILCS